MKDYMNIHEDLIDGTSTVSNSEYDDYWINELMCFVRGAVLKEDAVQNAKSILEQFKKSLSFKELLKLMLRK